MICRRWRCLHCINSMTDTFSAPSQPNILVSNLVPPDNPEQPPVANPIYPPVYFPGPPTIFSGKRRLLRR